MAEQTGPTEAPTYAEHAQERLRMATKDGLKGHEADEAVNLHHARTYALISIARSLEAIEGHLGLIARRQDPRI